MRLFFFVFFSFHQFIQDLNPLSVFPLVSLSFFYSQKPIQLRTNIDLLPSLRPQPPPPPLVTFSLLSIERTSRPKILLRWKNKLFAFLWSSSPSHLHLLPFSSILSPKKNLTKLEYLLLFALPPHTDENLSPRHQIRSRHLPPPPPSFYSWFFFLVKIS